MTDARSAAQRALAPVPTSQLGTWSLVETALGTFHVAAIDGHVVQTGLPETRTRDFLAAVAERHPSIQFHEDPRDPVLQRACTQLAEYAQGKRRTFDVPLRAEGTTFQQKVWKALAQIPFGETRSYQDIARAIGRPGASRAVGQANHENPVAPFIPCHRVVNAAGGLGGYGGGVELKRTMLELEGAQLG